MRRSFWVRRFFMSEDLVYGIVSDKIAQFPKLLYG